MIHPDYVQTISETDLCITTIWGAELWVVGLDKPERMEGTPWDGGVIDELANVKPGAWDANIRPALSDRNGWCWLIGVPDRDSPGQVEYKTLHERARDGLDSDWAAFSWPSADILPASEIEALRRNLDPEIFRQEMGGEFVLAGGLAFPSFDYKTHVVDSETQYDPSLPIAWSLDFNVDPMCSGVFQYAKGRGKVKVIKEFVLRDTDTNTACTAFMEWVEQNKINATNLKIYGDASGNARDSTSGTTDWIIVGKRLKNLSPNLMNIPTANPPIKDTLNAVRAKLRNAAGEVGIAIHSSCRQLIADFGSLLWPSDLEAGHSVAWLRYYIAQECPIGYTMPATGGRIGSMGGMMGDSQQTMNPSGYRR